MVTPFFQKNCSCLYKVHIKGVGLDGEDAMSIYHSVVGNEYILPSLKEIRSRDKIISLDDGSTDPYKKASIFPDGTIGIFHTASQWEWRRSTKLLGCMNDREYKHIGIDGLVYVKPPSREHVGKFTTWIKDTHDSYTVVLALTQMTILLAKEMKVDAFIYSLQSPPKCKVQSKRSHHIHSTDDSFERFLLSPGDVLSFKTQDYYYCYEYLQLPSIGLLTTFSKVDALEDYKKECYDGLRFICRQPYYKADGNTRYTVNSYGISYYHQPIDYYSNIPTIISLR